MLQCRAIATLSVRKVVVSFLFFFFFFSLKFFPDVFFFFFFLRRRTSSSTISKRAVTNPLQRAFNSSVQLLGLWLKQMKLWLRGCVTSRAKLDLQVALGYSWELQTLVVGEQGASVGGIRRTHGVLDTIINPAFTRTWEGHMGYLWMSL